MKSYNLIVLFMAIAALNVFLSGCTSTVTYFDENGKITKVEESTNFARVMDGTNAKSQMILVDGTCIRFEASATAGENCTPGVATLFANGKLAFVNEKDNAHFSGADKIIKEFFSGKVEVSASGVKTE